MHREQRNPRASGKAALVLCYLAKLGGERGRLPQSVEKRKQQTSCYIGNGPVPHTLIHAPNSSLPHGIVAIESLGWAVPNIVSGICMSGVILSNHPENSSPHDNGSILKLTAVDNALLTVIAHISPLRCRSQQSLPP